MKRCPFDGADASRTGAFDDEETGQELDAFECVNGHTWEEPSFSMIIHLIGWADQWRLRRDRYRDWLG